MRPDGSCHVSNKKELHLLSLVESSQSNKMGYKKE